MGGGGAEGNTDDDDDEEEDGAVVNSIQECFIGMTVIITILPKI